MAAEVSPLILQPPLYTRYVTFFDQHEVSFVPLLSSSLTVHSIIAIDKLVTTLAEDRRSGAIGLEIGIRQSAEEEVSKPRHPHHILDSIL
jgi:hypothetical protein